MIYLVTTQSELFESDEYSIIDAKTAVDMVTTWNIIQVDSETTGRDARLCDFLCVQLGNDKADSRLVIDTSTVDIRLFKQVLEEKILILQNAKFDLQFFFNYEIIPRKIYDTMVVEQFLHLGYSAGICFSDEEYKHRKCDYPYLTEIDKSGRILYRLSYSLKAIAYKRLGIDIDKTVRGEIIWRGLDTSVIKYAAGDVTYLEKIMQSQLKDLHKIPNAVIGAKIECYFIPSVAYMEWCGIKLDEDKWKLKMQKDREHLQESIEALNKFVLDTPILKEKFTKVDLQGDLFSGFNLEPQITINWSSSEQVCNVAKLLGFNVNTTDKNTGEDKESAMRKHMTSQKGINDEFLRLYFGQGEEDDEDYFPGYSGSFKVCSSFGQGHLNAINPKTGRIHTTYKTIGAISGRMSSGSKQSNTDLAHYKHIPEKDCKYPNMQQLPHDELTRACFVAEKGNLFCSCDYSAMEARIGADVYNEKMLLDEFLYRSGDTHAAYAKVVFAEELKDIPVEQIKKKRPDLRSKVKAVEFEITNHI